MINPCSNIRKNNPSDCNTVRRTTYVTFPFMAPSSHCTFRLLLAWDFGEIQTTLICSQLLFAHFDQVFLEMITLCQFYFRFFPHNFIVATGSINQVNVDSTKISFLGCMISLLPAIPPMRTVMRIVAKGGTNKKNHVIFKPVLRISAVSSCCKPRLFAACCPPVCHRVLLLFSPRLSQTKGLVYFPSARPLFPVSPAYLHVHSNLED